MKYHFIKLKTIVNFLQSFFLRNSLLLILKNCFTFIRTNIYNYVIIYYIYKYKNLRSTIRYMNKQINFPLQTIILDAAMQSYSIH